MKKHILSFSGNGTAAVYDTGGFPAYGSVDQIRWVPDSQDTGPGPSAATLTVWLQHQKALDTGLAQVIYNEASLVLGNDVMRAPSQPVYRAAGTLTDTGNHNSVPVVAAGDVLKARVLPADTGAYSGKLHIYTSGGQDGL